MRRVTQRMRQHVEMQGFVGLTDAHISDIYYWLRFAPAVGACWTAAAVLAESSWGLWTLSIIAFLGAATGTHAFDAPYTKVVRRFRQPAPIPLYGPPRRFAGLLAAGWLVITGALFEAGLVPLGRAMGFSLLIPMLIHVGTGYCLPCAFYRAMSESSDLLDGSPSDRL